LAEALPNCGLPLGTPESSPFVIITGDDVRSMTAEAIDRLLCNGAVMDFHALNALHELGFGERIGIKCGEQIELDELGIEEYTFGLGTDFDSAKCRQPIRFFSYENCTEFRRLISDERAIPWSMIRNFRMDDVAPMVLVRENEAGERFAVVAFSGYSAYKIFANWDRTRQMRRLFSHVARRPLPLAVHQLNPYIWLLLNKSADGRMLAGLINCSSDTTDEVTMLAGEEFARGFAQITSDGEKLLPLNAPPEADPDGTGALIMRLPLTLKPMDFTLLGAI
jgi:hypothetical protein